MKDLLNQIEGGDVMRDLTAAIEEVAIRARETAKPGTIALSIKVTPKGGNRLEIDCKVEGKPPKFDRPTSTLFVDDDGRISAKDPRQLSLTDLKVPQ